MKRLRGLASGFRVWGFGFLGMWMCWLPVRAEDLLLPGAPKKLEITKTETSEFPSGGTLHLKNSIGELTIEGWDQPVLEITTVKSSKTAVAGVEREKASKILDGVKIAIERKGDEVTVSTDFHKFPKLERAFKGMADFDLEYSIKVPRNAKLVIEHNQGDVHVDSVNGEIHASNEMGLIAVREPEGQYAIDAKSKLGAVDSDFPGSEKRKKWFGHEFVSSASTAPQKMFLRIEYGDILIVRINQPPPASGTPAGK